MKADRKGECARRALEQWVKIRRDLPGPSAFVGTLRCLFPTILQSGQSKHGRMYPASIYQRDCFAASFSDDTSQMMYAARQLQSIIPPKMAAILISLLSVQRADKEIC